MFLNLVSFGNTVPRDSWLGFLETRDICLEFSIDADCEKRYKFLLENCKFRFIINFKTSEGFKIWTAVCDGVYALAFHFILR